MEELNLDSGTLVNVRQIADLAEVGMSAVSNWRKRFDDFPEAVDDLPGARDLFPLDEVERWLRNHGRSKDAGRSKELLFAAADRLRGQLTGDLTIEVLGAAASMVAFGRQNGILERFSSTEAADWSRNDATLADMFMPIELVDPETRDAVLGLVSGVEDLGQAFEWLLGRQDRRIASGRSSGEGLAEMLASLIGPEIVSILDPAAGTGGFLRTAYSSAISDSLPTPQLFGQEINATTARLARQLCFLLDIPLSMATGDSISSDAWQGLRVDAVVADPPYGIKRDWPARLTSGTDWGAGSTPKTTDLAWLRHCSEHLNSKGRAYVFLPASSLFRGGADAQFRKEIVERSMVEAVISLPPGGALRTSIPIALWILRRSDSETQDQILLVDAAGSRKTHREQEERDYLSTISTALQTWRSEGALPNSVQSFGTLIDSSSLNRQNGILVPARWINSDLSRTERAAQTTELREVLSTAEEARIQLRESSYLAPEITQIEDWVALKDLIADGTVQIVRGATIKPDHLRPKGIPLLRTRDILATTDIRDPVFVDKAELLSNDQLTLPGDVVLSPGSGTLCARVDEEGGHVLQRPLQALRIRSDFIDPIVAAAFLQSARNRRFVTGSTYARVSVRDLELPRLTKDDAEILKRALADLRLQMKLASQITSTAERATELLVSLSASSRSPSDPVHPEASSSGKDDAELRKGDEWKRSS